MAKGFMVFVEGGNIPKVVHKTYELAFIEALRLSKLNPTKDVLLLEWHYRMRDGKKHDTPSHVLKSPIKFHTKARWKESKLK